MKKVYLIALTIFLCHFSNGQESFKKKYFIPTKLAYGISLQKDTIIKYEHLSTEKQDSLFMKYKDIDHIDVISEELIDGKKVTATRRIKVDDAFKKTLSINPSINVKDSGILGYVKFEEDGKLLVNRFLKRDNDGRYTRYPTHYYQLLNRQTVTLRFREIAVSALVIPIKYRCKGRDGLQEDFSTAFNANLFGGYTWGWSNFFHQEKVGNKTNTHKLTVGSLIGTSTVVLDKSNTSLDPNPLGDDVKITKGVASFGIGATYAFNKKILVFFGVRTMPLEKVQASGITTKNLG